MTWWLARPRAARRLDLTAGLIASALAASCSPAPRWVAVAAPGTGAWLLYDAGLATPDTLRLDALRIAGPQAADLADLLFGSDGAGTYVALNRGSQGLVLHVRRADGVVVDEVVLEGGRITAVHVRADGRSMVVATERDDPALGPRGVLHLLPTGPSRAHRDLAVCPRGVRALADLAAANELYLACRGDTVVEIDLKLRTVIRDAPLAPPAGPGALACQVADLGLSANGTVVFALCERSGHVLYLDRVTLGPLDSVAVGTGAARLARTPGGGLAVITRPAAQEVVLVDLRRRRVAERITTPGPATDVAIGADGRRAYVLTAPASGPGLALVVDLRAGRVISETRVPAGSTRLALWPDQDTPVMRWYR